MTYCLAIALAPLSKSRDFKQMHKTEIQRKQFEVRKHLHTIAVSNCGSTFRICRDLVPLARTLAANTVSSDFREINNYKLSRKRFEIREKSQRNNI